MWSPMPPRALSGLPSRVGHLHGEPRTGPEGADVVGGAVAVLAPEAVAAHAAVDEVGMAGDGGGRREVEPVERVGSEVADEHVRRRQQLLEAPAVGRVAQVEDDAPLPTVVEGEGRIGQVALHAEGAEDGPHGIAGGGLHLDDVRPPVGQQRGRRRGGDPDAELDHPEIAERREAGPAGCLGHRAPGTGPEAAMARRPSFATLPVALSGSASTSSTRRGTL